MSGERSVELPGGGSVGTSVWEGDEPYVLLAHGAGTDRHHAMVVGIAEHVAAAGLGVITFNYPYTEAGRRRPDRAEVLLDCHRAVLDAVRRTHADQVVLAGRSMGGRMATMIAAGGAPVVGVVAYAYPLHPAGKPDRLRVDHLPSVTVPMLFFQGGRDALSRSDLFDEHVRPLPRADVVDMPGADHSFRGRDWKPERLYPFLAEETVGWVNGLPDRFADRPPAPR